MAKKSVFRRATKWLKLSPDVMDAISHDDEASVEFSETNGATRTLFARPAEQTALPQPEPEKKKPEKQAEKTVAQVVEQKAEVETKKAAQEGLPF